MVFISFSIVALDDEISLPAAVTSPGSVCVMQTMAIPIHWRSAVWQIRTTHSKYANTQRRVKYFRSFVLFFLLHTGGSQSVVFWLPWLDSVISENRNGQKRSLRSQNDLTTQLIIALLLSNNNVQRTVHTVGLIHHVFLLHQHSPEPKYKTALKLERAAFCQISNSHTYTRTRTHAHTHTHTHTPQHTNTTSSTNTNTTTTTIHARTYAHTEVLKVLSFLTRSR